MNVMNKQTVLGLFAGGMLAACGAEGNLGVVPTTHGAALAADGDVANAQVRVVEGEFDNLDNSAECIALRGKIFKDRQVLKLTSEWRAVAASSQYHALETDKVHFVGAGCSEASSTPPAACAELQKTIDTDGDTLAATQQWAALTATDGFSNLMTDYNKAVSIKCIE
jgi:hypothetical protein